MRRIFAPCAGPMNFIRSAATGKPPAACTPSPDYVRRYSSKVGAHMFSWICPQCGREVPPSYTECPDCKAREAAAPPPQQPVYQTAPPQQPAYQAPPQPPYNAPPQQPVYQAPPQQAYQAPPQQPGYQAPPPAYQQGAYAPPQQPVPAYAPPRPRGGPALPTWLLTVLFA